MENAWDTVIEAVDGGDKIESPDLRNIKTENKLHLPMDGLFVSIGT